MTPTNSDLLRAATAILRSDRPANDKHVEVALATLVAAHGAGLHVTAAALPLWRRLVQEPARTRGLCDVIGSLPFEEVIFCEAVEQVRCPDIDPLLYEVVVSVLAGASYCRRVTPEILQAANENARGLHAAWNLLQLVESVNNHTANGLHIEFLRWLLKNWSSSQRADGKKVESVSLARLLPTLDMDWLEALLTDEGADVRIAAAVGLSLLPDAVEALPLVVERLRKEEHVSVNVALLEAQAAIIRDEERAFALKLKRRGQRRF